MKRNYRCHNEDCPNPKNESFVLELDLVAVMDEKNLAKMYCPHCNVELIPDPSDERPAA